MIDSDPPPPLFAQLYGSDPVTTQTSAAVPKDPSEKFAADTNLAEARLGSGRSGGKNEIGSGGTEGQKKTY